jgi:proteasome assembly chaperone (PAC2) family protein
VEVRDGILQAGELPHNRFFVWRDPAGEHDLILFIGESQPPLGKYRFCQRIVELAKDWGVERVITFASMASDVSLEEPARVFCTASNAKLLESLKSEGLLVLHSGQISGLNGVLLAVAVEAGLECLCLLGDMPHMFAHLPYPKAALAILQAFTKISGIQVDLTDLEQQAEIVNSQLADLIAQFEHQMSLQAQGEDGEDEEPEFDLTSPEEEDRISPEDRELIERLFKESAIDRSKAYELKRQLDRLDAFAEYENRFLDLFKKKAA